MYRLNRFSRRLCQELVSSLSSSCSHGNRHVSTSCRQFLEITFNRPSTGNLTRTLYSSSISYRERGTKALYENGMASKKQLVITYLELLQDIEENRKVLIIDVRDQKEIEESGQIPKSINIRVDDIVCEFKKANYKETYKIDDLSKYEKIIVSCLSGNRAATAQKILEDQGCTQVYLYKGSYKEWSEKQKPERQNFIIKYEQLLEDQKNPDVLIVDVRESKEINKTGKIPESINILWSDVVNEFETLSKENFKTKYGKPKPTKNTKIIFSDSDKSECVQKLMQELQYKQVYNFEGGWTEWKRKEEIKKKKEEKQ